MNNDFDNEKKAISLGEITSQRMLVKQKKQQKIEDALGRSGVPKRFINKSFSDYKASTNEQKKALRWSESYADKFESILANGVCMVLTGTPGTGKTHLALSILNKVLRGGYSGMFLTVSEMLRAIRGSYSPASKRTEQEVFNDFINADLLVLDEVGVGVGDETKRQALIFDVMNSRSNDMKPTIVIGNLDLDGMEKYLGFRVWDRLMEFEAPVISFQWESYRRKTITERGVSK